MSRYTGSKCICCDKRFVEGDDIVVCPDCGTPYHRSCYTEKGSCINAVLHDKNVGWMPDVPPMPQATPVPVVASVKRCIRCGAENPPEQRYCQQCGTPLINMDAPRPFNDMNGERGQGTAQNGPRPADNGTGPQVNAQFGDGFAPVMLNQDSDIDGVKLGDLARYVGSNPIGFLPSFIRFAKTGRKLSMNFFAFLFTPVYFMYRKMKVWGIVSVVVMALLSVPDMIVMLASGEYDLKVDLGIDLKSGSFMLISQIVLYLTLVLRLLAGFFANYLYYRQARREITRIHSKSDGKAPDDVNREIIMAGGTSLGYVVLGFLLYTIVSTGVIVLIGSLK
ncbi:RING finger protein [Ruminococcus sp.]|uniref:RING finger protein n=1 Tax=Ruminococcus sp. TaxID=41978 RepID=UPI0025F588F2|nr:RING finger protein [Ruminococcus sp.]MBQ8966585.1 DUF2628 domain-containing protein [Ruminococcus sp.]